MIPPRLRAVVRTFRVAGVAALAGFALLASAVAVASTRYASCGPSTLHALPPACSAGARLLIAAYVVLSIALLLGAASLTLLWRERRDRDRARR